MILGQAVEIVQQVDEQEFLAQLFGKGGALAKLIRPTVQLELPMPLPIVDNGGVVELRRADLEPVVGVGRDHQELIVAEERADKFSALRGADPNRVLRGAM